MPGTATPLLIASATTCARARPAPRRAASPARARLRLTAHYRWADGALSRSLSNGPVNRVKTHTGHAQRVARDCMHGNATLSALAPTRAHNATGARRRAWSGMVHAAATGTKGMRSAAQAAASRARALPGGPGARLAPGALVLDQLLREAGVDQQVLQVGVLAVGFPDLVQELRADDAAALRARARAPRARLWPVPPWGVQGKQHSAGTRTHSRLIHKLAAPLQ